MATKPLLLLDVDGVLCPFDGNEDLPPGCEGIVFENVVVPDGRLIPKLHVTFEPRQIERLRLLGEQFELVWATTWEEKANELLGPVFGLPHLPVIVFVGAPPSRIRARMSDILTGIVTNKLGPVDMYVGERPLAWVDDILRFDAENWAEERNASGTPTLLVRTNPSEGLTDAQGQELLAFATALSA